MGEVRCLILLARQIDQRRLVQIRNMHMITLQGVYAIVHD